LYRDEVVGVFVAVFVRRFNEGIGMGQVDRVLCTLNSNVSTSGNLWVVNVRTDTADM
jgi:hypothetical protein